ncbi:MAG: hypothetical protein QNK11_07550 [Legionella sp.]|nr:hypothetical protein [Legionella sp.]
MSDKRLNQRKYVLVEEPLKREDLRRKAKSYLKDDNEDEGGRSGESGRGRPRGDSYLTDDTPEREDRRREIEISGLIKATGLASETRRDRHVQRNKDVSAGEALEGAPQHPLLGDKQQYDGLDPDVNPVPELTTPEGQEAYQLQQQLQMQKRLELQNRLDKVSSIKPAGP